MPSRVLVMRHALSLYNEVIRNTPTHIADLDLNLIDSPLSSNGRKDLKVLAENWEDLIENLEPQDNQNKGGKKINFELNEIWCSPLRRAVETAEILRYELRKPNIPIKLKPFLRERLSTTTSISLLYGEIKNFPNNNVDFNELQKYKKYWLLEEINNVHSRRILDEAHNFDDSVTKIYELIKAKVQNNSEGIEPRSTDSERAAICTKLILEYVSKKDVNLLIISHGHLLKHLLKNKYKEIKNSTLYQMEKCEI